MSDDLVKRLRDKYTSPQDVAEAADRIEQLEAALREIDKIAVNYTKGGLGKAQIIARKALDGKDD
jgi:hypothetical protein